MLFTSERGDIYVAKKEFNGDHGDYLLSFEQGEELVVLDAVAGADLWEVSQLLQLD